MDAKMTNITAPTLHFYKNGEQSGSFVGDSLTALEVSLVVQSRSSVLRLTPWGTAVIGILRERMQAVKTRTDFERCPI